MRSKEHKDRHEHKEKGEPSTSNRLEPLVPTREDVAESRRFVEAVTHRRKRAPRVTGTSEGLRA